MFSNGILIPIEVKNSWMGAAASAGRAVRIKKFSGPNLPIIFFIFSTIGPGLPSTTLLNSEKSNTAPSSKNLAPFLANSSAFNLPLEPSGIVYSTLPFVNPTVSSKSKTDMPFGDLENLKEFVIASEVLLSCLISCVFLYLENIALFEAALSILYFDFCLKFIKVGKTLILLYSPPLTSLAVNLTSLDNDGTPKFNMSLPKANNPCLPILI